MVLSIFRNLWGQEVSPDLKTAHRAYQIGEYPLAAEKYRILAVEAEKQRSPRAPWLLMQAARSNLQQAQTAQAMKQLEHALSLLISGGFQDKAYLIGNQSLAQLQSLGKDDEAEELVSFLRFGLPGYKVSTVPKPEAVEKLLPAICPHCEGPVRPLEVRWKDSQTAECPYCGNPVNALQKVKQKA